MNHIGPTLVTGIPSFATGDCRTHRNRGLMAAPELHSDSDE
jgi:hypothetical protein